MKTRVLTEVFVVLAVVAGFIGFYLTAILA